MTPTNADERVPHATDAARRPHPTAVVVFEPRAAA